MVFQNYALWPHMSVTRNVAFGLEERHLPRDEIRRKTEAALELVGLTGYGDRRPNQLSGGQQQRVALARTLAIEPQVLLLDEPLSNLDAKLRVQMRRELRRVHDRLGITTIFVTHDQEEAMTICDRIAVLDAGVVQQVGTPVELYDRPANRFVAHFVGSVNLFEGTVESAAGGRVFNSEALGAVALPQAVEAPASGCLEIAFRPHAIALTPAGSSGAGDGIRLDGVIEDGEFLGEFMRYEVRVGSARVIADHPHAWGGERLAQGTPVSLAVPAREVRVIRT
jgi:iron(III) transport system ATP-binding protein